MCFCLYCFYKQKHYIADIVLFTEKRGTSFVGELRER
jgi:hypothetical protein